MIFLTKYADGSNRKLEQISISKWTSEKSLLDTDIIILYLAFSRYELITPFPDHEQISNRLHQYARQGSNGKGLLRLLQNRRMLKQWGEYNVCSQIDPHKIISNSYRCIASVDKFVKKDNSSLHPKIYRCKKDPKFFISVYLILQ